MSRADNYAEAASLCRQHGYFDAAELLELHANASPASSPEKASVDNSFNSKDLSSGTLTGETEP